MTQITGHEGRQLAMGTLQFLQRAQISGADVDNYGAVRNWLTMIANGHLTVSTAAPDVPGTQEKQAQEQADMQRTQETAKAATAAGFEPPPPPVDPLRALKTGRKPHR